MFVCLSLGLSVSRSVSRLPISLILLFFHFLLTPPSAAFNTHHVFLAMVRVLSLHLMLTLNFLPIVSVADACNAYLTFLADGESVADAFDAFRLREADSSSALSPTPGGADALPRQTRVACHQAGFFLSRVPRGGGSGGEGVLA